MNYHILNSQNWIYIGVNRKLSSFLGRWLQPSLLVCMFFLADDISAGIHIPDSFLNEEKVYEYSVSAPDTALAIIQTMREREMLDRWDLDYMEGNYYVNQRQYRKARTLYLQAIEESEAVYIPRRQMQIMMRLIAVDDLLYDDDEMIAYAFRMERIAKNSHDSSFFEVARFLLAKHRHFQGDSAAIADCLRSVERLQECDLSYKNNILTYCYADLVRMYSVDEQYDEALNMSFLQEQTALNLAPVSEFQIEPNALRKTYAMRACLYAIMGNMEEAEHAYQEWEKTPYANASDDKLVLDYLIMSNRFDEALKVIHAYKSYLVQEGDSISHWMLYALSQEYVVMDFQGNLKRTSQLNAQMFSITNELSKHYSKELMETTYAYMEKQEQSHQRYMLILYICLGVVVLVILLVCFAIYARQMRKRNEQLVSLVNGMDAYRYMLNKNDDISTESVEQSNQDVQPTELAADSSNAEHPDTSENDEELLREQLRRYKMSDDDKQLFVLMDRLVVRDKLFLNPNLNREDLMNLLGIDKNRFGKMMSHYCSATNASSYISAKRAEYAAVLLRQHPEFTVAAIAEMCGMNNTVTLNRVFKQLFGVTPSEYRSGFSGDTVGEKPKK